MFDIHKKCWIIPKVTGTVTARFFHTATVYDDKLFIYGGIGESETGPRVLGELQYLDLKTFKWSKPYKVPPRFEHSAAVINDTVWIYGGYIEENDRFICQRDFCQRRSDFKKNQSGGNGKSLPNQKKNRSYKRNRS